MVTYASNGYTTNGLPLVTVGLTGNETLAADTQLPAGIYPQSEAITVAQIAAFNGANGGVPTGQIGTGTEVGGSVTINTGIGTITTSSLTTAGGGVYTISLFNSLITATSAVFVQPGLGTNSATAPMTVTANSEVGFCNLNLYNTSAATAFNGTFLLDFVVYN